MDSNKLNDDKTEALVVGTRSKTIVSCDKHLEIGGILIPFQPKVKSLGVILDSSLTMSDHSGPVCRSAYLELRRISAIRPFLTTSTPETLVCSRFYLGLITAIPSRQVSLQIGWPYFKEY